MILLLFLLVSLSQCTLYTNLETVKKAANAAFFDTRFIDFSFFELFNFCNLLTQVCQNNAVCLVCQMDAVTAVISPQKSAVSITQ